MSSSTPARFSIRAILIPQIALALTLAMPAPAQADVAQSVLAAVNQARAKAGCQPLKLNSRLTAAADSHATAMAVQNFFGHSSRDGSKFSSRIKRQGYKYRAAAENIAAGQKSASEFVNNWLESPGHRRNILNCRLRDTGIAVYYQADDKPLRGSNHALRYYWVQVFAAP